eukprot:SAG11_NODE_4147_length_2041_cov_1.797631_2_plen_39_part_00
MTGLEILYFVREPMREKPAGDSDDDDSESSDDDEFQDA